jgi:hypothetical protein
MEGLLLSDEVPKCPKCNGSMDFVEDIERQGKKLKTFTCFNCHTFKLREA